MAALPEDARAQAWDTAAEGWDRHSPMLADWLREPTAAMLDAAGVDAGAQVLDVAAGSGEQTLDIARRVGVTGAVLATDISPRILALASAKLRRAGFGAVRTRIADAEALGRVEGANDSRLDPAFDACFDAVVCRLGLMFCRRPQAALAGALAALKPGGRYAALVFAAPQANPCIAIMAATARRHAGLAPASPFEPGTLLSLGQPGRLAELLAGAGFAEITVRALPAPMRLPDVRHYIDFLQTAALPIMALLAPLTAAAQHAAWQDIEQQLSRFAGTAGWVGPNELLLCAASRPAAVHTRAA